MTNRGTARSGRIVVTGGSGFIGRAVVAELLRASRPVTVVDKVPFSEVGKDIPGADRVQMITGDLKDDAVCEAAIGADTGGIIHLAAMTYVLKSKEDPQGTFAENVVVTQRLLELARINAVPRFVFASTNAVVGNVGTRTINTEMAIRPLAPYGATKAASEMLISGYAGSYGMSTCSLRFTNVYGPGMDHKDSFVPRLMRAALTGGGVKIYGDGTQRRDLVHLDDIVAGLISALDSEYVGTTIVGGGESVTVLQMVQDARTVTGAPIPAEHIDPPAGEMPAVIVELADSEQTIGYRPSVRFADGLVGTWEYFRESVKPAS
ncbi:NAD-dependent epimerase/dehydratase family protein [Microlunatus soli]|uniref:UDP-glucose 4-epimerase n=1 Tax=Microlunatus soli TaxID=630515 RepID=A0A1H1TBE9_9ACTN|nr:NAD-dependent epimerase/dehydratase family protein [Microlunatus soli]SDS57464.1 UDP-glucose 4-epimerase [Microlunatus soli]